MKATRVVFLGLVLACGGRADDPPKADARPMWQRMLQGDDAKRAAELEKQIKEHEAAGRRAEAAKAAEEALALRERVQGGDHWQVREYRYTVDELRRPTLPGEVRRQIDEAKKLTAQAKSLYDQGKYADAVAPAEAALRARRQALGEAHPDTAASLNTLALMYKAQGAYAKAEPLFLDALRARRQALGEAHPDTAASMNSLASLYWAQGAYAKAEPLFLDALRARRQALGEAHPHTATSLNNLAGMYLAQGAYAKAEPLLLDALRTRRQVLGLTHPDTAASLSNLAEVYLAQGAYAKAEPLILDALRARRQALGEAHPDTAASVHSLASLYWAQGAYAKAEPLILDALRTRRQALGEAHPDTATSMNGLALQYRARGAYAKAEPLFLDVLRTRRQALGEAHPDTAASMNNLGELYWAQGAYAKAEPLFLDALRTRRQALGEAHPDTAASMNCLATLYHAQGAYAKAEPLFLDALRARRQALGEAHPSTAVSMNGLATLYHAQGAYAKAEPRYAEAAAFYEASRLAAAQGADRAAASGWWSPYPARAATLAALGRPADACRALESDLARGLLDEQAARRGEAWTPAERAELDALAGRLPAVRTQVLRLATQPARTDAERVELEGLVAERARLDGRAAELAAALSRRELADPAAIQRALPADAALVAWVDVAPRDVGRQEHWMCVVRPAGDPAWERLPGTGPDGAWSAEDASLPRRLRAAAAGTGPAAEVDALARQLYDQRLAPAEKHLAGVKRLVVVPAGAMAGVPVEALIDRHAVSYVPSGTVLARLKDRPRPSGDATALVLGDPTFRPATEPPAPTRLPPGGLLITQVVPGGGAATARLEAGDVILAYAGTELTGAEQLGQLIAAHANAKTVPVKVWRESEDRPATRDVPPGKLGVALDKRPAPEAVAAKHKTDQMLAKLRGGGWAELPGSRAELDRLGKLFGGRAMVLAGSDASEPRLNDLRASGKLKGYRYLHFATHGEANDDLAFESSLILAQEGLTDPSRLKPGEAFIDGKLSAREVLTDWELGADLVTLSACESGLGREGGGDGLLGFAQAFLKAGARSVCLSLWKVDDAATALLMDRFYGNLLARKLPKAEALAEAKRWLRGLSADEAARQLAGLTDGVARGKNAPPLKLVAPAADAAAAAGAGPFAHPHYWAGFVLIGDPA